MVDKSREFLDAEKANELMTSVLEHYITHHKIVVQKLEHAKNATLKECGVTDTSEYIRDNYIQEWADVIDAFNHSGLAEEVLFKIEQRLEQIPKKIYQAYKELLEEDVELQALMKTLNKDEYLDALAQVREIQSHPDPMSGLGPEEFSVAPPKNKLCISEDKLLQDM